jgi:predicted secreted hydrolase
MIHAAVTRPSRQEHRFAEVVYRATDLLGNFSDFPDRPLAWSRAPAGTQGEWTLDFDGQGFWLRMNDSNQQFGLELQTRPQKPIVFQGPNGYSRKSEDSGAASMYYSYTRLDTSGSLSWDGEEYAVSGTSWMDKEFSSGLLGEEQVGWDWFSLQLDDQSELMVFQLRRKDGSTDYRWATSIQTSGEVEYLRPDAWNVAVTDTWTSRDGEARYPSGWRITLRGRELLIVPEIEDQENRSELVPGLAYWEGMVRVNGESGNKIGTGYVELTGYRRDSTLPL